MTLLLTGICGFVGSTLARALLDATAPNALKIVGLDNLSRHGSWTNVEPLRKCGVRVLHGDIRSASDIEAIGPVDCVIDAAANPSVLAGVDGQTSSRQLLEHNLTATINLLELCKAQRATFILLSTSRVYSIPPLASLKVSVVNSAFIPIADQVWPVGLSVAGVSEEFSTAPPVSLYGTSKVASEQLALEYGATFGFPVWINRCGVLAGAGQFGRADQGIFAYWLNAHLRRRSLRYIGFDGEGHQVRDCLHPRDLLPLLQKQLAATSDTSKPRVINVSGGIESACSLRQLTEWCDARFGPHPVAREPQPRPFDLPWVVLDARQAHEVWNWQPQTTRAAILDEIATHAESHPQWLELSS